MPRVQSVEENPRGADSGLDEDSVVAVLGEFERLTVEIGKREKER